MRVNYLEITNFGHELINTPAFKIKVSNLPQKEKTYTDEEVQQALESIRNWLK